MRKSDFELNVDRVTENTRADSNHKWNGRCAEATLNLAQSGLGKAQN